VAGECSPLDIQKGKFGVPSNKFPLDVAIQWWARSVFGILGGKAIVEGTENVPVDKPTLFMYSHASYFDPLLLAAYCPISAKFVFKRELIYLFPYMFVAAILCGYIPIDRGSKDSAIHSLRNAAHHITAYKRSVVISPEGSRTSDGTLLPFKKGPFHLALDAGVEHVIPVMIFNNFELWPRGRLLPDPGTLRIKFGKPVKVKPGATVDSLKDDVRNVMLTELNNGRTPKNEEPKEYNIWPALLFLSIFGGVLYFCKNLNS